MMSHTADVIIWEMLKTDSEVGWALNASIGPDSDSGWFLCNFKGHW